jgi:hypothetical protein
VLRVSDGERRKPKKRRSLFGRPGPACPVCLAPQTVVILWGMPGMDDELQRAMDEKRVVIGGCVVSLDDPKWECAECGAQLWADGRFEAARDRLES